MLVNSYDGGEDLWDGFFTTVKHEWKDFDMPIVLNTESKSYSFEGFDIQTFRFYKPGQNVPWAKRLIRTLKAIKTDYIVFFLEDFWLEDRVDTEFLEKSLRWMQENPDVAVLSFKPVCDYGPNIRDNRFERFERRPQAGNYRFNCQAAIWRRKKLIKYLRPHESPWEWELWGSRRSARFKEGFYVLMKGEKEVFPYDLTYGGVIHRGKWNKQVVEPIAKKIGISICYSKRGIEVWGEERKKVHRSETKKEKITFKVLIRKTCTLMKIIIENIRKVLSLI